MASFSFNSDHGDIDPCGTCLEVIASVFGEEPEESSEEAEPTAEELLSINTEDFGGRYD
jgi:cytidine deaminase